MELNRLDYAILKLLKKNNCTSFFESMTLQEIIAKTGTARSSTYRNMQKLIKYGYISKGCKSTLADTFYIIPKGVSLIENGGMTDD